MQPGTVLGNYEIVGLLGTGGMGSVYRARDTKLGREVAIKVLLGDLTDDPKFLARFEREAKILASINHPNIATIFGFEDAGDTPYLVLECLEGETLHQRLQHGRLPIDEAVHMGIQMAHALEAAHEKDVVHRDLKPSNVMLCAKNVVKILDFGIAKSFVGTGAGDTSIGTRAADLTDTGALIGTAPYMSPEQVRGRKVDRRIDVWAFGCVLFEALTASGPFTRETVADTLAAILEHEPRWDLLPADTPPGIERVLRRCLQKDVERRARDLWDVRLELEETLSGGTSTRETPPLPRPEPAPSTPETPLPPRPETPPPRRPESATSPDALPASVDGHAPVESAPHDTLSSGERRQVTLLTSSVAGYDALIEHLAPGDAETLLQQIQNAAREVVESHGGIINHAGADVFSALFGVPTASEDDAARAVRAALELHQRVRALTEDVQRRVGETVGLQTSVHSGTVVAHASQSADERYSITGSPVRLADRLCAEAQPDEILLSTECHRVVGPFFEVEEQEPIALRGSKETLLSYRVTGASGRQSRLESAAQIGLTEYTGRQTELETLRGWFGEAAAGAGQMVTIEGEAGAGKSRLLYEFCNGADCHHARLIQGRCRADSAGVSYLPFIEALRGVLEISGDETLDADEVVGRILEIDAELSHFLPLYLYLLSIDAPGQELPQHLQGDDFRIAMLEALAAILTLPTRDGPLVLVLEDWHWVDEASHEVLRQLSGMISSFALLIVVTFRPERDLDWARGAERQRLLLEPLGESAAVDIMKSVLGVAAFPVDLAHLIYERTGGNPFFLEELCSTLEEDGIIEIDGRQALLRGSLDKIHLPDTVQAVILTRLDRLDRGPRETLRLASVVGREFGRRILEETLPDTSELMSSLEALKELGLVQQLSVLPEALYRFKNALTQEVAYGSLLQHQRRAVHGQVGEAIERIYADRLEEHAAHLALHFGAAEEWEKAIEYGHKSARRAGQLQRFDEVLATLSNVRRWLLELPQTPERQQELVEVLLEMERACETLGQRTRQQELIDEAMLILEPLGDTAKRAEAEIRQGELLTLLGKFEEADVHLENSIRVSRQLGDPVRDRAALRALGFLRWQQERYDDAIECNNRALEISRTVDDPGAIIRDIINLATVLRSAGKPDLALEYLQEALGLSDETGTPSNHAYLLDAIGRIYRDLGDDGKALEMFEKVRDMSVENHQQVSLCFALSAIANIYWERGDTDEGLELYEEMAHLSRGINYAEGLSLATRHLGDMLSTLQRDDEALAYMEENLALSAQLRDQKNEALAWMRIAELHERTGRHDEATSAWEKVRQLRETMRDSTGEIEAYEGLARSHKATSMVDAMAHYGNALRMATGVNDREKQGELLNSMAITEWRQGNHDKAIEYYERALSLFEELEDQVHVGLVLNSMAVTLKDMGDAPAALTRAEEALRVNRATGQQLLEGHTLAILGDLYFDVDSLDEALKHYEASLDLRREIADGRGEGWMLHHLSRLYAAKGMNDLAGSFASEAAALADHHEDAELRNACAELNSD